MFELAVRGDFCASHILHGHEGKCKNLHGHTWKVEVIIASEKLDQVGRVVDFSVVKKQLYSFLETLDHVHLNDLPAFQGINPSTENLAKHIFDGFSKACPTLLVQRVTVWESENSSVTYYL